MVTGDYGSIQFPVHALTSSRCFFLASESMGRLAAIAASLFTNYFCCRICNNLQSFLFVVVHFCFLGSQPKVCQK